VSSNPVHGEVYSIQYCHWLLTGRYFFPGPLVSSTNKTDCHNIAEILLKVALNTINPQSKHWFVCSSFMLNVSQSHRKLNYFKLKSLVLLTLTQHGSTVYDIFWKLVMNITEILLTWCSTTINYPIGFLRLLRFPPPIRLAATI
jgi:hypothetical protein